MKRNTEKIRRVRALRPLLCPRILFLNGIVRCLGWYRCDIDAVDMLYDIQVVYLCRHCANNMGNGGQ